MWRSEWFSTSQLDMTSRRALLRRGCFHPFSDDVHLRVRVVVLFVLRTLVFHELSVSDTLFICA